MRNENLIIAVLIILQLVGVSALWFEIHPDFILLTPINLLVTFGLVLVNHKEHLGRTAIVLAIPFVIAFLVELAGVNYGVLFGDYAYGPVLGPKVHHTPLMIGFNWAMLVYCSGVVSNALFAQRLWVLRALVGAALMTTMDVLIEPVAVHYNFWTWSGDGIPLSNYRDWFLVSLVLHILFQRMLPQIRNKAGIALFVLQMAFFFLIGLK